MPVRIAASSWGLRVTCFSFSSVGTWPGKVFAPLWLPSGR